MTPKYLSREQKQACCSVGFTLLFEQLQELVLLMLQLLLLLLLAIVNNMQALARLGSTEQQCIA
jgi:hypothetical protein